MRNVASVAYLTINSMLKKRGTTTLYYRPSEVVLPSHVEESDFSYSSTIFLQVQFKPLTYRQLDQLILLP